eukprot:GDKK01068227.1.p1 GENE.GDKK01068227.1~~GDKK01068227.1.p1  ORF type:complete len:569 (-),score=137.64 GDKK01068227.1:112-1818(-)
MGDITHKSTSTYMTIVERKSVSQKVRKSVIDIPEDLDDFNGEMDASYVSDSEEFMRENEEEGISSTKEAHIERVRNASDNTNKMRISDFCDEVDKILRDYVATENASMVHDSLRHLNCPLFHDDFVYRALTYALLGQSEDENRAVAVLLALLHDAQTVTTEQMLFGFERCLDEIPYLPATAADGFVYFVDCGVHDRFLPASFRSRHAETVLAALSPETLASDRDDATNASESFADQIKSLRAYKAVVKIAIGCLLEGGSLSEMQEVFSASVSVIEGHQYMGHELVRRLLQSGFESNMRSKEMISCALVFLRDASVIDSTDLMIGVLRTVSGLEDSVLDAPTCDQTLTNFILRMIGDDLLAPVFVSNALRLRFGGKLGREVMKRAQRALSRGGCVALSRLESIWISEDNTSVEYATIRDSSRDALNSYFSSLPNKDIINWSDLNDEERRTLEEVISLKATTTAHSLIAIRDIMSLTQGGWLVKKCLISAMEAPLGVGARAAGHLLRALVENKIVYEEDIQIGLDECWDQIEELKLDIPSAPKMLKGLEKFIKAAEVVRGGFQVRSVKYL